VFGLGHHRTPVSVRVVWPSGRQQAFSNVVTSREYIIIEGDDRTWELPR
jgi:hypothetical protein